MTGPSSRSTEPVPAVLEVGSTAAAEVLIRPADRRFLEPFLGRVLSIGEAAAELGETVESTAYRVRTLVAKGLVRPVGRRARKGRTIVLYSAAPEIRAPLTLLPSADVLHLFDAMDDGGRSLFLSALSRLAAAHGMLDWTVRLFRVDGGQARLEMVPAKAGPDASLTSDGAPSVAFNWIPIATDAAGAKRLQRELHELVQRLPVSTSAPSHIVGVFLSPL